MSAIIFRGSLLLPPLLPPLTDENEAPAPFASYHPSGFNPNALRALWLRARHGSSANVLAALGAKEPPRRYARVRLNEDDATGGDIEMTLA